ncbi:MAG: insulinase family protein [Acidobacteria bacterium]|nr:insulinase family protein [Acidobacteriota bacterium]
MTRTRRNEIYFFCLVISLCLGSVLGILAQKQQAPSRARSPRKPVMAPAPVSRPKAAPEQPPVASAPQAPFSSFQSPATEAMLENGLKVLLQENHSAPLVSVGCWYRVGSKDDPAGAAGLSNLARRLSLRETESYSKEQTRRLIGETGGFWDSSTSLDQTAFFETVPAGALEEVLKLEAARMTSSVFEDSQVRVERKRAAGEARTGEDDSRRLLDNEVAAVALTRHPYRWPAGGWLPDVESINLEELLRHYRQQYAPNNAILVVVGGFETRRTLGLVERHFGKIARQPDPRRSQAPEPEPRGERRIRVSSEAATPYLQFAFRSPELFNDDFYAMLLVDAALTGAHGMSRWSDLQPAVAKNSSRLFQALVDKGLALEVRSRLMPTQSPSLYQLTITLSDAFQFQAAEEALLEQLERMKNQELSDVELAKAKNLLVAGEFLGQDSISGRAYQLGYFESVASHKVLDEWETKISRVAKSDLRRVAIRYFAENSRTVGSVVPALKVRTVEVESLSAISSDSQAPVTSGPQPKVAPRELNVRLPSLRPVLTPESVFPAGVKDSGSRQGLSKPGTRTFSEIQTASPCALRPQRKVLPNSISLIVAANKGSSTVTVRAAIRAGADRETDAQAGIAAFVSAMLKRGTSVKSNAPLGAVFDFLGAEVSTDTDYLVSTTTVRGLSKDTSTFLQLLGEMFQSPSFTPSDFDQVRAEQLGRLREQEEDPVWVAEQALRQRVYPLGNPLRRMAPGAAESVENLKLADVKDFYRHYYRPEHLVVSIAGDVQPEQVLAVGESAFGGWKEEAMPGSFSAPRTTPGLGVGQRQVAVKGKRNAQVLAGIAGVSTPHPDYYPLLILNQILGGIPWGGRLGDRMPPRDASIHFIQSQFQGDMTGGLFSVSASADPAGVDKVIALIREEMDRMRDPSVTEAEVRSAKRSLINAWAVQLGSNEGIAHELLRMELHGLGEDYLQKYPSFIEAVSMESLLDCARTRFVFDQAAVVVAGPGTGN